MHVPAYLSICVHPRTHIRPHSQYNDTHNAHAAYTRPHTKQSAVCSAASARYVCVYSKHAHTYAFSFFLALCRSRSRTRSISLNGYCSTVQGLLDWFEVDLGFTELLFIQIDLCVMCFCSLLPSLTLLLSFPALCHSCSCTRSIMCSFAQPCLLPWQQRFSDMLCYPCVVSLMRCLPHVCV